MSLLKDLNEQQKEAVLHTKGHLRIIAGAGSGKTRVVTTRIAYLIRECNVFPNKILAITFTNKAAKEMKDRIYGILNEQCAGIHVSTIHSFCVRLLREDIHHLGYPRNFTIIDTDDSKSILKDAYKLYGIDIKLYSYASVLSYISNNKTHFVSFEEAKTRAEGMENEQVKATVYEYYQKRLKEMMALDFDDLLIFTFQILKQFPDLRLKWQNRFEYIHVDEFQDVDKIQYGIIKGLTGEHAKLCVVGDPDQTIYTWRGAEVNIIMNFERDFKNAKTVILNENYRSTPSILNGANSVIANNKNRIKKDLFTRKEDHHKIVHYNASDEALEPKWIVKNIRKLKEKDINYSDIAVLYRSNYLSRSLEKCLLEEQIPYRIYGGLRFYDRAEIKDALSYLRLMIKDNPASDLAVKRIINVPKRGIGPKTVENISLLANTSNVTMYDVIKDTKVASGKTQKNIEDFVKVIEDCRKLVDEISVSRLLELLMDKSGYMAHLEEEKETERIENVKELISDIEIFEEENPENTLELYLQNISLYTDKEEKDDKIIDCVQLMTVHAAKGLEFDYVFVSNLCEGIFPNERSVMEGGREALEEERRLAYVAFTRARKRLFLSNSRGYSFVLDKAKTPSRFINEINDDCIEHLEANVYQAQMGETKSFSQFMNTGYTQKTQQKMVRPSSKGNGLKAGDHITHTVFGEGVVVSLKDGIATIAFEQKYGVRKLLATHPSITKI